MSEDRLREAMKCAWDALGVVANIIATGWQERLMACDMRLDEARELTDRLEDMRRWCLRSQEVVDTFQEEGDTKRLLDMWERRGAKEGQA